MREEICRVLPEVPVRALEPQELGQLSAREIERQSRLEADEHDLGKEADGVARANQPGRESHERHEEGDACGQRRMPGWVTGTQRAHRCANQQRQRRRDGDDGLLRAAEQPEDQARKEASVEARFGRESGKRGVANPRGQQICGECQSRYRDRGAPTQSDTPRATLRRESAERVPLPQSRDVRKHQARAGTPENLRT